MGILYWTSYSIWNGTWIRSNLDYEGKLLNHAKEFVERRQKKTMTNMVACLDRDRATIWGISTKIRDALIKLQPYPIIKDKGV